MGVISRRWKGLGLQPRETTSYIPCNKPWLSYTEVNAVRLTMKDGALNVRSQWTTESIRRASFLSSSFCFTVCSSHVGFCTPGIIVSIYTLLSNNHKSAAYLEEHLDGNLCRCTGYRPIWDAARSLCDDDAAVGPCGTPCRECPERDTCQQDCNVQEKEKEVRTKWYA